MKNREIGGKNEENQKRERERERERERGNFGKISQKFLKIQKPTKKKKASPFLFVIFVGKVIEMG